MGDFEGQTYFRGSASWAQGYANELQRFGLFWQLVEISVPANPNSNGDLHESHFVEWCRRFIGVNPHGKPKLRERSRLPLLLEAFRKAITEHPDAHWGDRLLKRKYEELARRIESTSKWTENIAVQLGLLPPESGTAGSIGKNAEGDKKDEPKIWCYRGVDPATCRKVQSLPISCYWCGEEGHYGGDCPFNPRERRPDDVWTMRHAKFFIDTTSSELCIEAQAKPVDRDALREEVRQEMLAEALEQERLAIQESKARSKAPKPDRHSTGEAAKDPNLHPHDDKQKGKQVQRQKSGPNSSDPPGPQTGRKQSKSMSRREAKTKAAQNRGGGKKKNRKCNKNKRNADQRDQSDQPNKQSNTFSQRGRAAAGKGPANSSGQQLRAQETAGQQGAASSTPHSTAGTGPKTAGNVW